MPKGGLSAVNKFCKNETKLLSIDSCIGFGVM